MARTTEAAVLAIFKKSSDVTDVSPFIAAASLMISQQCPDISEESAVVVETWLAAHFLAIRDRRLTARGVAGITQTFQHTEEVGLGSTEYGQTAMQLDETGGLSAWNAQVKSGNTRQTVQAIWLGEDPNEPSD